MMKRRFSALTPGSVHLNEQVITVTYTDGTASRFARSFSD